MTKNKSTQVYSKAPVDEHTVRRTLKRVQDITYKDRLSRVAFSFFKKLFEKYNCKITVMSEVGSTKLDKEEIFEEIFNVKLGIKGR